MSVCSIRRPPIATSTLATLLTSPPAEKPTKTWSMVVPAIRSACSTASRIAISLFSMSAMKPRLTPRLSRWPVPRMCSRPSSSRLGDQRADLGRADVERGDQWLVGGGGHQTSATYLSDAWFGNDRLAGLARDADDHVSPGIAHVEADEAAAEQRVRWSIIAKLVSAARAAASPSGSGEHSPLWKRMSQRRWPTQVAAASCACRCGAGRASRRAAGMGVGAGADQQRQIGHRLDPHRSSTTPSASISLSRSCSARSPPAGAR